MIVKYENILRNAQKSVLKTVLLASVFFVASCASVASSDAGQTAQTASSIHSIDNSAAVHTLRRMSMGHPGVGALFYRSMNEIYPTETVGSGPSTALPIGAKLDVSVTLDDKEMSLDQALVAVKSNGFFVLHKGEIVYEKYFNGADADSKFASFSMSKSITSMLVGIIVDKGLVDSISDPIDKYLPQLKGSPYEGVTIRQMLMMRSGTNYQEGYDPKNPTHLMRLFDGAMVQNKMHFTDFAKLGLERINEPGSTYNYSTMETGILGLLIEKVTGQRLAQVMEEMIWKPAGMEQSAYWLLDGNGPEGQALAGGGFNATLHDYARLGAIMLNDGRANGTQIVSSAWVSESTIPTGPEPVIEGRTRGYQYQWWTMMDSDAYQAIGIFGQFILVDPASETVIVKTSYWPKSWVPELDKKTEKVFDAILNELSD
ncbi:MAG: 6-aminohexanoate hydrolase [Robiginitomaculum sp.]|nr:MAG: 6-aminohexanoate hydrolase [Robiginitomaculum sp.]